MNLDSYMAVTTHYASHIEKHLFVCLELIAFRYLDSHSGANIGQEFVQTLDEIGCLHKVSFISSGVIIVCWIVHKDWDDHDGQCS